ncbi:HNH endonuclease [Serratia phage vB_SmaS-Totoro]|nr:HNH endonuclease [Serratia phage vB_SmaS-Totoro]
MEKTISPWTESSVAGFYLIEGFSRYAVNEEGKVLDLKRGVEIPVYRDKKGYRYNSVVTDSGKRVLYQHYRLMMIAMSDRPDNYRELVINHKDNIHGHDELSNLEWCTVLENNRHAISIGAKRVDFTVAPRKKVKVFLVNTKEELDFPSARAASEYLGISPKRLDRILSLDQPFFRGEYLIKLANDPTPWRVISDSEPVYNETGRIILVRDVFTGEVTEWLSMSQYANHIGLSKDAIAWRLKDTKQRVYPEMKQYKYKGDNSPWRELTNEEKSGLVKHGQANKIFVRDLNANETFEFNSQTEMANVLGISIPTVTLWLSKNISDIKGSRYLIHRGLTEPKWRHVESIAKELAKNSRAKKVVVVTNRDGTESTFLSAAEACRVYNIGTTTANWRLKTNGEKVYPDGTCWRYLSND